MSYDVDNRTWRSPNFSERASAIESIVIHSCEGVWPYPRSSSLPWLCNPASRVSAHYYVCRNTEVFQLVDDNNEAWHAGVALPRFDNGSSIGVECEHRGGQNWTEAQRSALAWLLRRLMAQYHIPLAAVETHGQIAIPGPYKRKVDPTDWPHDDFVRWRARLTVAKYRAKTCAPIFQSRDPDGVLAGSVTAGTIEQVDNLTAGWIHLSSGLGFSPVGCWEMV